MYALRTLAYFAVVEADPVLVDDARDRSLVREIEASILGPDMGEEVSFIDNRGVERVLADLVNHRWLRDVTLDEPGLWPLVERVFFAFLTPEQLEALCEMLRFVVRVENTGTREVFVLDGRAGSGKTTVMSLLAMLLSLLVPNTARNTTHIVTPTNQVAHVFRDMLRMYSSTGKARNRYLYGCLEALEEGRSETVQVSTLHTYLRLQPRYSKEGVLSFVQGRRGTVTDSIDFLTTRALVVEEASMLSRDMLSRLGTLVRSFGVPVLLCGDANQLPPITTTGGAAAGEPVYIDPSAHAALLHALGVPDVVMHRRSLRTVKRYSNGILRAATAILDNRPVRPARPEVTFVTRLDDFYATALRVFQDATSAMLDPQAARTFPRIIAYRNATVAAHNTAIQRMFYGATFADRQAVTAMPVFPGDLIVADGNFTTLAGLEIRRSDMLVVRSVTDTEVRIARTFLEADAFFGRYAGDRFAVTAIVATHERTGTDCTLHYVLRESADAVSTIVRRLYGSVRGRCSDAKTSAETASRLWTMFHAFEHSLKAPIAPGYAITCHKVQGSTISVALVDYNDVKQIAGLFAGTDVEKRWLYTAVTRASTAVYIYH